LSYCVIAQWICAYIAPRGLLKKDTSASGLNPDICFLADGFR